MNTKRKLAIGGLTGVLLLGASGGSTLNSMSANAATSPTGTATTATASQSSTAAANGAPPGGT